MQIPPPFPRSRAVLQHVRNTKMLSFSRGLPRDTPAIEEALHLLTGGERVTLARAPLNLWG